MAIYDNIQKPDDGSQNETSREWRLWRLPHSISIFAVAGVIGLTTGVVAFLLKECIRWVSTLVTSHFNPDGPNYWLLLIPVVGIMLAVAFQRLVVKQDLQHGVDQFTDDLHKRRLDISPKFTYGPLLASIFTLGFGGSAGAEGPIATSGAAMGSIIGQKFKLPPRLLMILIGCGAGAGIAGIFKSPLGGVMFTLEVLGMSMGAVAVIALFIACLVSGMTAYGLSGFTTDVPLVNVQHFDPHLTLWVIALGVFCGVYTLWYDYIGAKLKALFLKIKSRWWRGLLSGGILAVLVFLFPALYGEGYDTMAKLIDGNLDALVQDGFFNKGGIEPGMLTLLLVSGGIAMVKSLAATATNSGGGVAGEFAPTLFAGCMVGLFFAWGLNMTLDAHILASNFGLIAMAAVMAGVIRAPLMAIFIVIEMTGYFNMMFPVAIAAGVSYGTVLLARHMMRPARH